MQITVCDIACPICGAPEVDPETNQLLVRGFKTGRDGLWWSQCISGRDHGSFDAVYEDGTEEEIPFPEKPWFAIKEDGSFLVEVGHKDYTFK